MRKQLIKIEKRIQSLISSQSFGFPLILFHLIIYIFYAPPSGDKLLTKQAIITICLGFSPGVLIELAFIKYHQQYGGRKDQSLKDIHCFIDERCIKDRLPETFHEQIKNVFYYKSLNELKERLTKASPGLKE